MRLKIQHRIFSNVLKKAIILMLVTGLWISHSQAEVTLDGSLGPARSLPGPNYQITADVGRQAGTNLFHSFGKFNLNSSESATFTNQGSIGQINNILSRVTSGKSFIDGLLRSTIPDANLYFINPAGIVFGDNARLDVQGSFHATTADYLRLGDGTRFSAVPSPQDTVLTTASPEAFGFLTENPSSILVESGQIDISGTNDHQGLEVLPDKTLSLVGGNLIFNNGILLGPGAKINLVSANSLGEIKLDNNHSIEKSSISRGGISISDNSLIDVSANNSGEIHIVAGRFRLSDSTVKSDTKNGNGRGIYVNLDGGTLANQKIDESCNSDKRVNFNEHFDENILINGGLIKTGTSGIGNAGNIIVTANRLYIDGAESQKQTGIISIVEPAASGNSGSISVDTNFLEINGNLSTNVVGIGSVALPFTSGNTGSIEVCAHDNLNLVSGGLITTSTFGTGSAGNISVHADSILLEGTGLLSDPISPASQIGSVSSAITSSVQALQSPANSGNVEIKANVLNILNGSVIDTSTKSDGNAGNIFIEVNKLKLGFTNSSRGSRPAIASISGSTTDPSIRSKGNAGKLNVIVNGPLDMSDGGVITSSTFSDGDAGEVIVNADRLFLSGVGTFLRPGSTLPDPTVIASSAEDTATGAGGNISINVQKTLSLANGAAITTRSASNKSAGNILIDVQDLKLTKGAISSETINAPGGSIWIQAKGNVILDKGLITTSVARSNSDAGNITIRNPKVLVLIDNSRIEANTFGGKGGFVNIESDHLIQSLNSVIRADAISKLGIEGKVNIDSPDINISMGLLTLPDNFLHVTEVLRKPCAQQSGADVIQLVVRKYEVLPQSPYALWDHMPNLARSTHTQAGAASSYPKLASVQPMDKDCSGNE